MMWYNLIMVVSGGALMAIGFAIYVYYQERKKPKQLPMEGSRQ